MITREFVEVFANEWISAWNSHNLDLIMSHYAEGFEFSSPFVITVAGEPSGRLKGHAAVGAYWSKALARRPDLHFRLVTVFAGVASAVIHYQRHDGSYGAEHFEFDTDGKVLGSSAHYVPVGL
ncbi:MAG: nuclear transport factor 2 family protein [Flavobacteriales bacterium]|nr:nuclear transport factor 2 family protein [Flavobacteriales bacterium]